MSIQMKKSISNLIIWSFIGILFVTIFFKDGIIKDLGDNFIQTIILISLFIIGYIGQFILKIIFRKKEGIVIKDERDEMFLNKAISNSFIATLVYVFIILIWLYESYEKSGLIPVMWLWFVAYSLIPVSNILSSSFLIYYYRRGGH